MRQNITKVCWPPIVKPHRFRPCTSQSLIGPTARRWARIIIQYSLLTAVLFILFLWLGAEYQEYRVRQAGDTLYLYSGTQVCTISRNYTNATTMSSYNNTSNIVAEFNNSSTTVDFTLNITTVDSIENVPDNNTIVAHCGDCGQCSNPQDVGIYDNTRNSLYSDTVDCAKRGLIWGRKTATKCMAEKVGFTQGCNDCWVENIMCDLKKCIFVCLWYGMFSELDGAGQLNKCTYCDEVRCGPDFVTCAGVNRRRSGILSDIERNQDLEVCHLVTRNWWDDVELQQAWSVQQDVVPDGEDIGDDDDNAELSQSSTFATVTQNDRNGGARRLGT